MIEEIEKAVRVAFDEGFKAGEAKALETFRSAVGRIAGGEAFAVTDPDVPPPELIPIAEAAKRFKVTANTIYTAIRRGKLKVHKKDAPGGARGLRDGKIQVVSLAEVKTWREAN